MAKFPAAEFVLKTLQEPLTFERLDISNCKYFTAIVNNITLI